MEIRKTEISSEIERLHSEVKGLLDTMQSEEEIIQHLQQKGLERHYIEMLIANIQRDRDDRRNFRYTLALGLFSIIGGMLINYFSYRIAGNSNGSFFYVFWGIIAFGILTTARAFILYKKK